jgi:hypothetical protein
VNVVGGGGVLFLFLGGTGLGGSGERNKGAVETVVMRRLGVGWVRAGARGERQLRSKYA